MATYLIWDRVTITADPGNVGDGGLEISLNIDTYDKGLLGDL